MVITALARAKINLTLDVLGKRPDGYHEVEMVMQSIELYDRLEFTPAHGEISLAVAGGELPVGRDNLVYRAAELIRHHGGVRAGVKIRLEKAIPVAAGLGGGSADAAATLAALNEMWGIGLSLPELMALGEQLGADVPFCLAGGTALARGKGEKIEQLPPCPRMGLALIKPPFGVATAAVYRAFTPRLVAKRPDTGAMMEAIRAGDIGAIARNLANVLEPVTAAMRPEIMEIKQGLLEAGALGALMSGSGPTVFGLTPDQASARMVAARCEKFGERALVTGTYNPEQWI